MWKVSNIDKSKLSKPKYWRRGQDDELKAGCAIFEGDFDFVVWSPNKPDSNLIHHLIASTRTRYNPLNNRYEEEKCLLQQLEERGYDLSTLKISIKKVKE